MKTKAGEEQHAQCSELRTTESSGGGVTSKMWDFSRTQWNGHSGDTGLARLKCNIHGEWDEEHNMNLKDCDHVCGKDPEFPFLHTLQDHSSGKIPCSALPLEISAELFSTARNKDVAMGFGKSGGGQATRDCDEEGYWGKIHAE